MAQHNELGKKGEQLAVDFLLSHSYVILERNYRFDKAEVDIIAIKDDDLNLTYHNPALLVPEMNKSIVLNYVNYFTDVNYGYAAYATKIKDYRIFCPQNLHVEGETRVDIINESTSGSVSLYA